MDNVLRKVLGGSVVGGCVVGRWAAGRFFAAALVVALIVCVGCGGGGSGSDAPAAIVFMTFQAATTVIGQDDFLGGLRNKGGVTAGDSLAGSSGTVGEGSLYVADPNNHRILGFDNIPGVNGTAADFVLGQPDFVSNASGTTAAQFKSPKAVIVAGGRLFLCDAGNHRVLIWNTLPTSNVPADVVVGQSDFVGNAAATSQSGLTIPSSVAVVGGRLIVDDLGNSRVLIWNTIPTTNGAPADVVVGQADFVSSADAASASGLSVPAGVASNGTNLVVADTGNNRVLIWSSIPTTNGQAADVVVGQADFSSQGSGLGPQGLTAPFGAFATSTQLFVADTNNNRVLIYEPFPTSNNPAAGTVLGQMDFVHTSNNDDDQDFASDATPSARTLFEPAAVTLIGTQLFVGDDENSRILIFDGL